MVEYNEQQLDMVFQALADGTRRGMLKQLQCGEQTVSNLARPYQMSLAAASKHIKKLEKAGLVEREVVGRVHHCRMSPQALRQASEWLKRYEQFWSTGLDRLEVILEAEDADKQKTDHKNRKGRDDDNE